MDRFFYIVEANVVLGMLVLSVFWWFGKFPSAESVGKFMSGFDSRGGQVAILCVFSLLGTFASLRLMYYIIQLSVDGKLQQDNSYALLSVQFVSNTITGAFIGALLKTMGGDAAHATIAATAATAATAAAVKETTDADRK